MNYLKSFISKNKYQIELSIPFVISFSFALTGMDEVAIIIFYSYLYAPIFIIFVVSFFTPPWKTFFKELIFFITFKNILSVAMAALTLALGAFLGTVFSMDVASGRLDGAAATSLFFESYLPSIMLLGVYFGAWIWVLIMSVEISFSTRSLGLTYFVRKEWEFINENKVLMEITNFLEHWLKGWVIIAYGFLAVPLLIVLASFPVIYLSR